MAELRLTLTDKELAQLRKLAKQRGYTIPKGKMAGHGSVRQLAQAIAKGKYLLIDEKAMVR